MTSFRDVAADGVLLAGGGRAILLQIAHPAVGAGVARHSDFANQPLDRLNHTLSYIYATVFGSPSDADFVRRRVNAAHALVRSTAGEHPEYSAFDPAAQLWVAATLYQTAVTIFERVYGTLSANDREDVYRGYAVLGTALQVPAELWPVDTAEFAGYWATAVDALTVTDDTRRVAHDLLHPRTAPLWLRSSMPLVRLLTIGLLDSRLRREFVLPWSALDQRRFDRTFRLIAAVWPRLPRALRSLPRTRYLAALRRP